MVEVPVIPGPLPVEAIDDGLLVEGVAEERARAASHVRPVGWMMSGRSACRSQTFTAGRLQFHVVFADHADARLGRIDVAIGINPVGTHSDSLGRAQFRVRGLRRFFDDSVSRPATVRRRGLGHGRNAAPVQMKRLKAAIRAVLPERLECPRELMVEVSIVVVSSFKRSTVKVVVNASPARRPPGPAAV